MRRISPHTVRQAQRLARQPDFRAQMGDATDEYIDLIDEHASDAAAVGLGLGIAAMGSAITDDHEHGLADDQVIAEYKERRILAFEAEIAAEQVFDRVRSRDLRCEVRR